MNLNKIRLNKTILTLAFIVILFQFFGLAYIVPRMMEIAKASDEATRNHLFQSLGQNIPFLVTFVVGGLSTLIFPAMFFIINRNITTKKWLLVIIALGVYFLKGGYIVLATICLGLYLWRMWEDFQSYRKKA